VRFDTVDGAARVAGSLGWLSRTAILLTVIVGFANINAFNLYGAMMSSLRSRRLSSAG